MYTYIFLSSIGSTNFTNVNSSYFTFHFVINQRSSNPQTTTTTSTLFSSHLVCEWINTLKTKNT